MMSHFIDIIVTGNLGNITHDNWAEIYSEYSEISMSKEANKTLDTVIQITYLTNRINIVKSIVHRLQFRVIPECCELLKEMGFYFDFDNDYQRSLDKVGIKIKGDEMRLAQYQAEYKESQESENKKATKQDWQDIITELAKFHGYAVKQKEISVSEYCALDKSFRNHVEMLNRVHNRQSA